ncbi:MAG: hypothetical protein WCX84_05240 [Syntrophales bacterium]|jgi:hypothetical protein|nr:hypothetical protein [Syntrophales bacterium]
MFYWKNPLQKFFLNICRSGKKKRSVPGLSLPVIVLVLLLLSMTHVFADNWNKGGNLHDASVYRWKKSSQANRVATSADWFLTMTRQANKSLWEELQAMNKEDYEKAFRFYANRLERCVSERVEKKSVRRENRIQGYAEKCYDILHGSD